MTASGSVPFAVKAARRVCYQHRAVSPPGSDSAIPFVHLTRPCGLAGLLLMAKGTWRFAIKRSRPIGQPAPPTRLPHTGPSDLQQTHRPRAKNFHPTIANDRPGSANDPPTMDQRSGGVFPARRCRTDHHGPSRSALQRVSQRAVTSAQNGVRGDKWDGSGHALRLIASGRTTRITPENLPRPPRRIPRPQTHSPLPSPRPETRLVRAARSAAR